MSRAEKLRHPQTLNDWFGAPMEYVSQRPAYSMDLLWTLHHDLSTRLEKKARISLTDHKPEAISPTSLQNDYPKVLAMYGLIDYLEDQSAQPKTLIQGQMLHNEFGLYGAVLNGNNGRLVQNAYPTHKINNLQSLAESTRDISTEMVEDPDYMYRLNLQIRDRFYNSNSLQSPSTLPISDRFVELGISDPAEWARAIYNDAFHQSGRDLAYAFTREAISSSNMLLFNHSVPTYFEVPISIASTNPLSYIRVRIDAISIDENIEAVNLKTSCFRNEVADLELRQAQLELYGAEILATEFGQLFFENKFSRGYTPRVYHNKLPSKPINSCFYYLMFDKQNLGFKKLYYTFNELQEFDNKNKNGSRKEFMSWLSWYSSSLYLMRAKSQIAKLEAYAITN